jgi:hypothetical protein
LLTLAKTDDVDEGDCVSDGEEINYRIDYNYLYNPNLPEINDVNIIDYLPVEVDFNYASAGGVYDSNTHSVKWNLDTLSPGESGYVTLSVLVDVHCPGPGVIITNHCEMRSASFLTIDANETTEVCLYSPTLTKSDNLPTGGRVSRGDEISYSICYADTGCGDVNVLIIDELPDEVNYVSSDHGGVYNPVGHTVTWSIGTLEPNESGCVSLTVEVKWSTLLCEAITNKCEIRSDEQILNSAYEYTSTYCCLVAEDFDSYASIETLWTVWKDWQENWTCAQVYLETETVRDGNSMQYLYNNSYLPYYSEAYADTDDLGMDPNWLGMGAKVLSLWFYGQSGNDANEQMYVKLYDTGSNAVVIYGEHPGEDPNYLKDANWHKWNIKLEDFNSAGVDLTNVTRIAIGFGDGMPGGEGYGIVYFEDVQLCASGCILAERAVDFAKVDYAPPGDPGGDCVIDYQELAIMAGVWLERVPFDSCNPYDINLVAYWPMDEGIGDMIFTSPYDSNYTGIFSAAGVSWITPGVMSSGALHFDDSNGTRVGCGNVNPASEANQLTLSIWAKWAGPHLNKEKGQGLISKRTGWTADGLMFMFEVDTYGPGPRGTFGLRQFYNANTDVFAPENILMEYIGQWVHLAATFDGNTAVLYLNGVEVSSGPFSFGGGTDAGIVIGNNVDEEGWPESPETFNGDLDEVRIYNRALTAGEIAYLANADPSPANLYDECLECPRVINFWDFAVLVDYWLEESMWP